MSIAWSSLTKDQQDFVSQYLDATRYAFVYTGQSGPFGLYGLTQPEPPPIYAAYLIPGADHIREENGHWHLLGCWKQTGVSHLMKDDRLAIQWCWHLNYIDMEQ